VRQHNIDGDLQSDLTVHGGPNKAVYCLKQGIRGCVACSRAEPTLNRSPTRTSSSVMPSVVRFSPNTP
jgi:hypothetical protein